MEIWKKDKKRGSCLQACKYADAKWAAAPKRVSGSTQRPPIAADVNYRRLDVNGRLVPRWHTAFSSHFFLFRDVACKPNACHDNVFTGVCSFVSELARFLQKFRFRLLIASRDLVSTLYRRNHGYQGEIFVFSMDPWNRFTYLLRMKVTKWKWRIVFVRF